MENTICILCKKCIKKCLISCLKNQNGDRNNNNNINNYSGDNYNYYSNICSKCKKKINETERILKIIEEKKE